MELSIIRSLMNLDFHKSNKGTKCPDKIFSKEIRKIKQTIDLAMDKYKKDLTVDEIIALFLSNNPTMTTANKQMYTSLFQKLEKTRAMSNDVARDVLSSLFR